MSNPPSSPARPAPSKTTQPNATTAGADKSADGPTDAATKDTGGVIAVTRALQVLEAFALGESSPVSYTHLTLPTTPYV